MIYRMENRVKVLNRMLKVLSYDLAEAYNLDEHQAILGEMLNIRNEIDKTLYYIKCLKKFKNFINNVKQRR